MAGVWRPSQELMAELQAGRIYVNLHTALSPAGEVRGQLTGR